ncbi:GDP-L-fucose synthase [Halarcobacter ebronensis]|uniref:GDP-L-fucose synthase n=1 Tax=Halarcobacter ebronensis TaxID=1462615 RepID=A0A4Q0YF68_9BACT|nr:GDP-L-fucose synthase [Halarcobacter ebronensis]RXJ69226.1 GDP-L-fucose synthase [Halarcobacter ebronensis]
MKTFSILGTGWLGFALAKELKKDYSVKVSIRDLEKENQMISEGLEPYLLDENNLQNLDSLLNSDFIFINFPPKKSKDYITFLENIYSNKNILNKKVIFISSTSIYKKEEGVFDEDSPLNESNSLVFKAENLIKNKTDIIFRCSGLMGYNRIAGKYFAGKSLDCEDSKVNYVHRDDVINATKFVIENDISGIFNLCSKVHPTKKEIYTYNAKRFGFEEPIFKNKKSYENKIIDGSKIESLGFRYKYPNPIEYF